MASQEKRRVITLGTLSYNRHGFLLRGYDLFKVSRRDIIRQEDHNNVKFFLIEWMKYVLWDSRHPDLFSQAENLVERKYGEFVYPEDWNTVLQLLRNIDDAITADGWPPKTLYADMPLHEQRRTLYSIIVKSYLREAVPAGGIDSWSYNDRLKALRYLDYIAPYVPTRVPPETEPEFPRLRLYNSTNGITVYCTKNPRTHYGKESGMPSNYVYSYWFEDGWDWDYDDALVRIYWEFPNWKLEIYKGTAADVHNWYYDDTFIVGTPSGFPPDVSKSGEYHLYAAVWLDGRTKDLVKYERYG